MLAHIRESLLLPVLISPFFHHFLSHTLASIKAESLSRIAGPVHSYPAHVHRAS